MLDDWLRQFLFISMRWLHVVCTTLVVGGTLFFEFVVPLAVEDLKTEQQLTVFGKARWVFKRVIWPCALLLLVSGAMSILRLWQPDINGKHHDIVIAGVVHIALGVLGLGIALLLTVPRSPPDRPVGWMRINLGILLVCILAATVARHLRLTADARQSPPGADARRQADETLRGAIVGPESRRD